MGHMPERSGNRFVSLWLIGVYGLRHEVGRDFLTPDLGACLSDAPANGTDPAQLFPIPL